MFYHKKRFLPSLTQTHADFSVSKVRKTGLDFPRIIEKIRVRRSITRTPRETTTTAY